MWTPHSAASAVHPIKRNGSAHILAGTSQRAQSLKPAGTIKPNVFMSPRIWLESSVQIRTSRVRAATSVRVSMLSKPFHPHLAVE